MSRQAELIVFFVGMTLIVGAAIYGIFFRADLPPEDTFKDEFALTLTDYNGNAIPLSEFRRKALIVYMWASWCPYCADELRNLAALKQRYGDDVQILAVNRAEPRATAKEFTDSLGLESSLTFLLDREDVLYRQVGGYAMPETVFIDEGSAITFHQRGPVQLPAIEAQIQKLLE